MADEDRERQINSETQSNGSEAESGEGLTKIDWGKLRAEISNFRDHFSWKDFVKALLFGLLASAWDTSSDFNFAEGDHNDTIRLINASDIVIITEFPNSTIARTFTDQPRASLPWSRNFSMGDVTQTWQQKTLKLDGDMIKRVTYLIISLQSIIGAISWILNVDWCCCLKMGNQSRQKATWRVSLEQSSKR